MMTESSEQRLEGTEVDRGSEGGRKESGEEVRSDERKDIRSVKGDYELPIDGK
jgi:hypothetical protein